MGTVGHEFGRGPRRAATLLLWRGSSHAFADTSVDVNLRFNERQPPAALVESLKREAAAIWRAYGVDLQWRSSALPFRGQPMSINVLLDQHPRAPSGGREVLGDTLVSQALVDHIPIRLDREATQELLRSVAFGQVAHLAGHWSECGWNISGTDCHQHAGGTG